MAANCATRLRLWPHGGSSAFCVQSFTDGAPDLGTLQAFAIRITRDKSARHAMAFVLAEANADRFKGCPGMFPELATQFGDSRAVRAELPKHTVLYPSASRPSPSIRRRHSLKRSSISLIHRPLRVRLNHPRLHPKLIHSPRMPLR